MRTTIDIEDDVLLAVKAIAKREKKTAGKVLSDLARRSLSASPKLDSANEGVLGFRAFARRGGVVTEDIVEALRDEGPY